MARVLASIAMIALLAGCGKEPPPPSGPPPVAPSASGPASAPAPKPGPAATEEPSPKPLSQAPPAERTGGGEVVAEPSAPATTPAVGEIVTAPVTVMIEQKRKLAILEARNILKSYEALNDEPPKSLEEAAKALGVKCPLPPDGYRWKYDPRSGEVEIEKE